MLVISRKTDESIIIEAGEHKIEVVVLETTKDRVKLGVAARARSRLCETSCLWRRILTWRRRKRFLKMYLMS